MILIAPFLSEDEHLDYCDAARVDAEDDAIGFKLYEESGEKLGLIQIKMVGDAAYLINVISIEEKIMAEDLANAVNSVVEFLRQARINSIIYPIQELDDEWIARRCGFEKVGDTLYFLDVSEPLKERLPNE